MRGTTPPREWYRLRSGGSVRSSPSGQGRRNRPRRVGLDRLGDRWYRDSRAIGPMATQFAKPPLPSSPSRPPHRALQSLTGPPPGALQAHASPEMGPPTPRLRMASRARMSHLPLPADRLYGARFRRHPLTAAGHGSRCELPRGGYPCCDALRQIVGRCGYVGLASLACVLRRARPALGSRRHRFARLSGRVPARRMAKCPVD
jgi:hypothetical protein